MTSSQNAALLAQWADLWGGNISLADELVTDDFVAHVAPMPWAPDVGETGGREALKKWISGGYRDLIPDMQNSADVGPIADKHYMVVRWKVEGTYNGGFPGSSPDPVGRTVAFTGTDIVRIEDGKFAEYWLNVDSLFFMQQIGVHEVPALT
jgi:predicted ester cyclase